jgi:thymidylate kinase
MVKSLMYPSSRGGTMAARVRLVVEVAGLAGAGKTTLAQALRQCDQHFMVGVHLRRTGYLPYVASITRFFLPVFLRQYRHSRWFTREEMRSMIYLKAWHHVVSRQRSAEGTVAIMDHGPVYRLAWLQEFGPEIVRSRRFAQWSDGVLEQWAAGLDLVIWLDAADAVLVERIAARDRWHVVKGKSEQATYQFLTRYRTSYDQVLSRLTANGGPKVLRFNTDQESLDQILKNVLECIGHAVL